MGELDFQDIVSAFATLFAVIDIIGSIPVIISMKEKGRNVSAVKASGYSSLILVLFFFAGNSILNLFQIDVESFAVAGAIILFLISVEMLLDVELFKNQGPSNDSTLVPLVFPLIAGAGSFVTLLSLKAAKYDSINILIALLLNMIVVFFVLRSTDIIHRFLGKGGVYMLRKFFGIILMAMAAHLFTVNVMKILNQVQQ